MSGFVLFQIQMNCALRQSTLNNYLITEIRVNVGYVFPSSSLAHNPGTFCLTAATLDITVKRTAQCVWSSQI